MKRSYVEQLRPLTDAQHGIWYAHHLDPGNPAFHMACYLDIRGSVDPDALARAVGHVMAEESGPRARFVEVDGQPRHLPGPPEALDCPVVDLARTADPELAAQEWMRQRRLREYDLSTGPLIDCALLQLFPERTLWYLGYHQLVMDGAGVNLLVDRVAEVYSAFSRGSVPAATSLTTIDDYLASEAAYRSSGEHHADERFFTERLAGRPAPVRLCDHRLRHLARQPLRRTVEVDAEQLAQLKDGARRAGTRWLGSVIAAVGCYLARMRRSEEVMLSLVLSGRGPDPASQRTPTRVSNVLPLPLTVLPTMTWSELAAQVSAEIGNVRERQRFRGERLRGQLPTDGGRFFGPVINMIPGDGRLDFAGHPAALHHLASTATEDLSLSFQRTPDGGLRVELDAHPQRYDDPALDQHIARVRSLLVAAIAEPDQPVSVPELLSPGERHLVIEAWNDTYVPIPDASVPELFNEQAARNPDAVAVDAADGQLSYRELHSRADRLARRLVVAGVIPETPVAVLMERSAQLVVALLAILKAGGAYVPLDQRYPTARMRAVLDSLPSPVLVVDRWAPAELTAGRTVIAAGTDEAGPDPAPSLPKITPANLAYVMHTSGSTGLPKGVAVTHRNIVGLVADRVWRRDAHHRVLFHSPHAFDAATYELWVPLLSGGRTVVAPAEPDAPLLRRLIREGRITATWLTAGLFAAIAEGDPGCLAGAHEVWTGGEAVSPRAVRRVLDACPELTVVNGYGPTETTTFATCHRVERQHKLGERIPIGRPLDNTRTYVLDEHRRPLPPGAIGELFIAGAGVARDYAGQPDLTDEVFLPDPFRPAGERMYATGDLVSWRDDGTLDYLGRADEQVKLHGFRIEPGEIEVALTTHPQVSRAAVVARAAGEGGGTQLVAYLVAAEPGTAPDPAALRHHLSDRLPEYMLPARYIHLPDLPLTANGKVDHAALPVPRMDEPEPEPMVLASSRPREEILCHLFAEVLGEEVVGPDEDFFELGGHSLLAARVMNRVRDVLGVDAGVADLFEARTAAVLVARLEDHRQRPPTPRGAGAQPTRPPLSPVQHRFWLLYQLEGPSPTHNIPMAVRLSGELDVAGLRAALTDLSDRHEPLRTVYPADNGVPYQRVLPPGTAVPLAIRRLDESALPEALTSGAAHRFDLATEAPVRATLFTVGEREHVLLLVLHHIAGDGWSLAPLRDDLRTAYQARLNGRPPAWQPLPMQYADYARRQVEMLGAADDPGSQLHRLLGFWTGALAGLPAEVPLPADRPRAHASAGDSATVTYHLDAELHRALLDLSRLAGATLFMVVQAGLAALLTRLGSGTDLPIGAPAIGRPDSRLDRLVGCFVNTLVLRVDTAGDPGFGQLLARVRGTDLAAYDHQDLPFDVLVDRLNPPRVAGRHPLFQVALSVFHTPERVVELPGLHSARVPVHPGTTPFDLAFICHERHGPDLLPGGIDGTLEYSLARFEPATARSLTSALVEILRAAAADPDRRISELGLATALLPAASVRSVPVSRPVAGGAVDPDLERRITARWCEVLAADHIGPDDNFFDRGGNSLSLVTLHAKLCAELGVEFGVQRLFENPTVRSLTRFLSDRGDEAGGAGRAPADGSAAPASRAEQVRRAQDRSRARGGAR